MKPWIGVIAYYTLAIWTPESVWFWIFGDIRISLYISIATITGCFLAVVRNKIDFSILKSKQNLFMALLWLSLTISFYFSPYGSNETATLSHNSEYLISLVNKVFLMYFFSILLINTHKKIYYLALVIVISIIYHTFWANSQYYNGTMHGLRLAGPAGAHGNSMYFDENTYAMLFVCGIPFLFFLGNYFKKKIVKYIIWGIIPFAWQATFLTGSRGGLVGLAVISLGIALRSKSKFIGLIILLGLVIAFVLQGETIKERGATMLEKQQDESVLGRFEAWKVAIAMCKEHPLTGVGIGNFVPAFQDYSGKHPLVAHNTFFQLTAESGLLAGLSYLFLAWGVLKHLLKKKYALELAETSPLLYACNSAVTVSMIGFFACALFLSLATYEILYYLLILNIVIGKVAADEMALAYFFELQNQYFEHPLSATQD
jgi:putative inorganic carbon (hco3(-)) transporter